MSEKQQDDIVKRFNSRIKYWMVDCCLPSHFAASQAFKEIHGEYSQKEYEGFALLFVLNQTGRFDDRTESEVRSIPYMENYNFPEAEVKEEDHDDDDEGNYE